MSRGISARSARRAALYLAVKTTGQVDKVPVN